MNKELKQTLLAICQKYSIKRDAYTSYSAPGMCMSVSSDNVTIRLEAGERDASTDSRSAILPDLHIDLTILHGGATPAYSDSCTIFASELLACAAGVVMPTMNMKKRDLLDIYNAMRNKLYEQQCAETPAPSKLLELQQAFKIRLNEKGTNGR